MELKFPSDKELYFVLVTPEFEAPTKKMRAALPAEIGMVHHVWNCSQAGALVASVLQGMEAVKRAAINAGAFGCTISGAGPTAVAVIDNEHAGHAIAKDMVQAFLHHGNLNASAQVKQLDRLGARRIHKGASGHYTERKDGELCKIVVGVVEASHLLGVIHRDLKPENYLLINKDDDFSPKAIDFGLSVFLKPGQVFTDIVGNSYYVAQAL
ncbi:hypothetical protein RJT34_10861 [Clitoria ternatea]|uniref:Protein kinase domain-containing protein n=1 Tax=Clitoria ternatea TaxID=43366 RepID=A0AAN9JIU6_CLITE